MHNWFIIFIVTVTPTNNNNNNSDSSCSQQQNNLENIFEENQAEKKGEEISNNPAKVNAKIQKSGTQVEMKQQSGFMNSSLYRLMLNRLLDHRTAKSI